MVNILYDFKKNQKTQTKHLRTVPVRAALSPSYMYARVRLLSCFSALLPSFSPLSHPCSISVHSFMQQIFTEHMLISGTVLGPEDANINKTHRFPFYHFSPCLVRMRRV